MNISSIGYLFKEGLKNIWSNRMMSLASLVVLASCLIITGSAVLISFNVQSVISSVDNDNEITVFLEPELSDEAIPEIEKNISEIKNISSYKFSSKEDVLKTYKDTLGDEIYNELQGENNPFGNEYKVTLNDLSEYNSTSKALKDINGVEKVSDLSDVAGKLTKLNYFVTIVGSWLVLILAAVTLFIISNTIKMTMYSRRFEISIMKSVGASNSFIRMPFVIEAMTTGFISGLIAAASVLALYEPVKNAAAGIIGMLKTSTLTLDRIWLPTIILMSAAGIIAGLFGSIISVSRYLSKEGGAVIDL